jgi:hypothetical protein
MLYAYCRLVDGIPLAILLAASWIEMLSAEEIAGEIEEPRFSGTEATTCRTDITACGQSLITREASHSGNKMLS